MSQLNTIKAPVKSELEEFNSQFKALIHSDVGLLNLLTSYVVKQKGKQVRPLLVLLSAKTCGEVNEHTYTAASLIELMHTATLVHDDVVDNSNERRGIFSINALWRSKVAVLFGDYLLAKGLIHAVDSKSPELLRIVSVASKELSEGELLQIQKSRNLTMDMETYFDVIKKKTASLLSACTRAGAYSAGASESNCQKMEELGINLGIAFQIKDDLFDYQGGNGIGKPIGNDIREKKLTLPLLHALQEASASDSRRIKKLIRKGDVGQNVVNQVVRFVKEEGGVSFAISKMEEYRDNALRILADFPDSEARTALSLLIEFTVNRKK